MPPQLPLRNPQRQPNIPNPQIMPVPGSGPPKPVEQIMPPPGVGPPKVEPDPTIPRAAPPPVAAPAQAPQPPAQTAAPTAPTPPAAPAWQPNRTNFTWGSGAERGTTAGWTEDQWRDYDKHYNLGPPAGQSYPGAAGAAGSAGAPGGPQTAGQALTGAATVGGQPAQGAPGTVAGSFQQALLNALSPAPVTANDPTIAPAIQANQLAQQRGAERQRAQNAERNAATGVSNSGGATTEQIGLEQDRAMQEGQFNADAIQGQTDKNRQAQLMMAQLAGGMLSQADQQALSRYGIDQGDATQRYGIDKQGALGQGDLALRGELGRGQLNLGLLGQMNQNQQFGQSLASNNAQFGAGLNQQALLAMLGGL